MFDLRTYTEMFRIFTIIYINTPLSERADKGLCIIKKGSLCAHFKPFSPARYPPYQTVNFQHRGFISEPHTVHTYSYHFYSLLLSEKKTHRIQWK